MVQYDLTCTQTWIFPGVLPMKSLSQQHKTKRQTTNETTDPALSLPSPSAPTTRTNFFPFFCTRKDHVQPNNEHSTMSRQPGFPDDDRKQSYGEDEFTRNDIYGAGSGGGGGMPPMGAMGGMPPLSQVDQRVPEGGDFRAMSMGMAAPESIGVAATSWASPASAGSAFKSAPGATAFSSVGGGPCGGIGGASEYLSSSAFGMSGGQDMGGLGPGGMGFAEDRRMAGPTSYQPSFQPYGADPSMYGSMGSMGSMGSPSLFGVPSLQQKQAPILKPTYAGLKKQSWDTEQVRLTPVPIYLPPGMIKYEFPIAELHKTLQFVSDYICNDSIAADYCNSPVTVKLRTLEGVALKMFFWEGDGVFYVDVQRTKGDVLTGNKYIHRLLDAARGYMVGEEPKGNSGLNSQQIKDLEALIEKYTKTPASSEGSKDVEMSWIPPSSPDESTRAALEMVLSGLSEVRTLETQRMSLESMRDYTDVKKTMSSTAIPSSDVVLRGRSPLDGYSNECKSIQRKLFTIMQKGEIEGYEVPKSESGTPSPHPYFVEFMDELFLMSLAVLVNALETLMCFENHAVYGATKEEVVRDFLESVNMIGNRDIYRTLMECVTGCKRKLAAGYLACKALRLLAKASPAIQERVRRDSGAKSSIRTAMEVGYSQHILLKQESEQLWEVCF